MLKSSNPALSRARKLSFDKAQGQMTYEGVVNKTSLLFVVAAVMGIVGWVMPALMIPGFILAFILSMVSIFAPKWIHITAPSYALFEGLALGGFSAMVNVYYPRVPALALLATFSVFGVMLLLYRSGAIRATPAFKKGMMIALLSVGVIYLFSFVGRLMGFSVPFVHSAGLMGIGFSLAVIVIASLSFILDFDSIEQLVEEGAPKAMEWYGGFSLMLTLVWLYVEIVRLLMILRE